MTVTYHYSQAAFKIKSAKCEMLVNRRLKIFYLPRRHEGHEEIDLRVLRGG